VTTRAVTATLSAEVNAVAASTGNVAWIGYAVPAADSGTRACCGDMRDGGRNQNCCALEKDANLTVRNGAGRRAVPLEASVEVAVFVRLAGGTPNRVAAYSGNCEVDAGGRPVVWLTGVKPAESVVWLTEFATRAAVGGKGHDTAVAAIAFHADAAADAALERMALAPGSTTLQRSAVFWMGAARGPRGMAGLRRVLASSTDDKVRDQVAFALSVTKEPDALTALIGLAKQDRSAHVRAQALFWLAQKAGAKAAGTITAAIQNDPDTDVKTRAVFALSQLPADEGVPLLIDVARTNRYAEVRTRAMFWLGQSKDPRALAFFEEILAR
jgi:hypothetical protein